MYYKIVVQVSQVTLVPSKCCKMNELLCHERLVRLCVHSVFSSIFTGLGCELRSGAVRHSGTVEGDWLVHDEQFADHLPFAGPEQSYTVQEEHHHLRPCRCRWSQTHPFTTWTQSQQRTVPGLLHSFNNNSLGHNINYCLRHLDTASHPGGGHNGCLPNGFTCFIIPPALSVISHDKPFTCPPRCTLARSVFQLVQSTGWLVSLHLGGHCHLCQNYHFSHMTIFTHLGAFKCWQGSGIRCPVRAGRPCG